MGEATKIEWTWGIREDGTSITGYTFNAWIGCARVSPACEHCYAESMANHYKWAKWGVHGTRKAMSDAYWRKPLLWNAQAAALNEHRKVFCSSLADVFEDRRDLDIHRARLWKLIDATPNLTWLLLTKRPQNIGAMAPWTGTCPRNVWLGTTVENQMYADERIPELVKHAAVVRFLSVEPLLGPVDLRVHLPQLQWCIVGGESGPGARPMRPEWARDVRDQCGDFGVPFFMKQWGQHDAGLVRLRSKHEAGRLLDGREWNESPALLGVSA